MNESDERRIWWSVPLVVAAVGCGPEGPTSLDAGADDETSGDGDSGGGGGSDGAAPQLVSARTDETGKYVLLRFSEPMAPPAGVDPSDFRISLAQTSTDSVYQYPGGPTGDSYTSYYDPHYFFAGYPYTYMASVLVGVTAGGVATDLVLEFAEPLPPGTCYALAQAQATIAELEQKFPDFEATGALFPHYSPGATPVRSAQGEPLAAIGPEWVELDSSYVWHDEWFGFPNLSPQIPIDCIAEN